MTNSRDLTLVAWTWRAGDHRARCLFFVSQEMLLKRSVTVREAGERRGLEQAWIVRSFQLIADVRKYGWLVQTGRLVQTRLRFLSCSAAYLTLAGPLISFNAPWLSP